MKYPFQIIAGQGKGYKKSSLNQIGEIIPARKIGEAGVALYVNVANGNYVVCDRLLSIAESNHHEQLGYVFNKLATNPATCWQLTLNKLISMDANHILLREKDGHETLFSISQEKLGYYVEPAFSKDGRAYIYKTTADASCGYTWVLYHPDTQVTELFDDQGFLVEKRTRLGNKTRYFYDQAQQLTRINLPSGHYLTITRTATPNNGRIEKFELHAENQVFLLNNYDFDALGRLINSLAPNTNNYVTTYQYDLNDLTALKQISQSDGSLLKFSRYQDTGYQILTGSRYGRFTFLRGADNQVTLEMGSGSVANPGYGFYIKANLDSNNRFTQITRSGSYPSGDQPIPQYITQYNYTPLGQLQNIIHPNQSADIFEYEVRFNGISKHTRPDGEIKEWFYDLASDQPLRIAEVKWLLINGETQPLLSRWVFQRQEVSKLPEDHYLQLAYHINPERRVTHFEYDHNHHCVNCIRSFSGDLLSEVLFNLPPTGMSPKDPHYRDYFYAGPSFIDMEQWRAETHAQQQNIITMVNSVTGQPNEIKQYTAVDANGQGIASDDMGMQIKTWNMYGDLLEEKTVIQRQDQVAEYSVNENKYDDLRRLVQSIDPLMNMTKLDYLYSSDPESKETYCEHQTTQANGRIDTLRFNNNGIVQETRAQVADKIRRTVSSLDVVGRDNIITGMDGKRSFVAYDRLDQMAFSVTPLGAVTSYQNFPLQNYSTTIKHAKLISQETLKKWQNPTCHDIANDTILDKKLDQQSYIFTTKNGRKSLEIDAENFITQYFYDSVGRLSKQVDFADPMTSAELEQLTQGLSLERKIDPSSDQVNFTYYDDAGLLKANIDPDGWVTEHFYDAAGREYKTHLYATPNKSFQLNADFNTLRPAATEKDIIHYYFRNAAGLIEYEMTPNRYLIKYEYYPNRLKKSAKTYADPIDSQWQPDVFCLTPPPEPKPNLQDYQIEYYYDKKGQLVTSITSDHTVIQHQLDVMGQAIFDRTIDDRVAADPSQFAILAAKPDAFTDIVNEMKINTDEFAKADCVRDKRYRYDSWQQPVQEANAYISQLITAIEINTSLTKEEKQQKIDAIFQTQSSRRKYDDTGLLCQTTNSLNATTLYYYDDQRRLILTIDNEGGATQQSYDAFNNLIMTRAYLNPLTLDQRKDLTGGFITPQVLSLLQPDDAHDAIDHYEYDRRNQMVKHIDPEGNVATFKYNAFKKLWLTFMPVGANGDPSDLLKIEHRYNGRNLEIATKRTTKDQSTLIVQNSYENPLGKVTQQIDAVGVITNLDYDPEGNVTQHATHLFNAAPDDKPIIDFSRSYDARNRIKTHTDALNNQTTHVYDQTNLTHCVKFAVENTQQTTTYNVFEDKVLSSDATHTITQSWTHTADGQVETHVDELKQNESRSYDNEGHLLTSTNKRDIVTKLQYNSVSQLTDSIENSQADPTKQRVTHYELDGLYRRIKIIDPLQTLTSQKFDRNNRLTEKNVDPTGLNLLSTFQYNAQGKKISEIAGDEKDTNQYAVEFKVDGFNRSVGKVIDPKKPDGTDGLKLTSTNQLDGNNRVVEHRDPNQKSYWFIYDEWGNQRFKISANGTIEEKRYDLASRERVHITYENRFDFVAHATCPTLKEMVQIASSIRDSNDSQLYYFRDANGRVCFELNLLTSEKKAVVVETFYDVNSYEIGTRTYATWLDVTNINLDLLPLDVLTADMHALANANDQLIYHYNDAMGRLCFTIDPENYLHEQRWNAEKQIITVIDYAKRLQGVAPETWRGLSIEKLQEYMTAQKIVDEANDHAHYYVFDEFYQPQFEVNAEGIVTGFTHDANNNLINTIKFKTQQTTISSYEQLVSELNALKPDDKNDTIHESVYDAANRCWKTIDPLKKTETFTFNAWNGIKTRTDRNGNVWNFQFDRAKRQILTISPIRKVVDVVPQPGNQALSYTETNRSVQEYREYDGNNNVTLLTADYQGSQPRTVETVYNALNLPATITLKNVTLDDPIAVASFQNLPVTPGKTITRSTVYNTRAKEIVSQDKAGRYQFTVYNALQRIMYLVYNDGAVVGFTYNAFGHCLRKTQYANLLLNGNLEPYRETGITLAQIKNALVPSVNDLVTDFERDHRGNWTIQRAGRIYQPGSEEPQDGLYLFDLNQGSEGITVGHAEKQQQYNAFKQPVLTLTLLHSGEWAKKRKWYDKCNHTVATAIAQRASINAPVTYHVKRNWLNSFQKIEHEIDYYTPFTTDLSNLAVTLADLDNQSQTSSNDLEVKKLYDVCGHMTAETQCHVSWQNVTFTLNNDKYVQQTAQQSGDLTTTFSYTATGLRAGYTRPDGEATHIFYDNADQVYGQTTEPRQLQTENQASVIPLTLFGYDAHGHRLVANSFCNGANPYDPKQPIKPDAAVDKLDIKHMDNRGLVDFHQNPRGIVEASTYTQGGQQARFWHSTPLVTRAATRIDEQTMQYDPRGRMSVLLRKQDNTIVDSRYVKFDAFGNTIKEGVDGQNWPVYSDIDAQGQIWRTNRADNLGKQGGINTIMLRNAAGQKTGELQAQITDLSQVTLDDLQGLLKKSYTDIELTSFMRDTAGRLLKINLPLTEAGQARITNIPLQMQWQNNLNGDTSKFSLSWLAPPESNVLPTFSWQHEIKNDIQPTIGNGRYWIDVSNVLTGIYHYTVHYQLKMPDGSQGPMLYTTTGAAGVISNLIDTSNLQTIATVDSDHILKLKGNVQNIDTVCLYLEEKEVGEYKVNHTASDCWVDLANVMPNSGPITSGNYTAKPKANDSTLPETQPFVINTALPPATPLVREITASLQINVDGAEGTLLLWETLPLDFQKVPVHLHCSFNVNNDIDLDIKPDNPTFDFGHTVDTINSITLSLKVSANESILLYSNTKPSTTDATQMEFSIRHKRGHVKKTLLNVHPLKSKDQEEYDLCDDFKESDFAFNANKNVLRAKAASSWMCGPAHIAYLRGVPQAFQTVSTISYFDVSEGNNASWKNLSVMQASASGLVFNIYGFEPGIYPFSFPTDASATRYQLILNEGGLIFPSDNQISQAKKVKADSLMRQTSYQLNVRGKVVQETKADGAVFTRTYNHLDKLISEIGPNVNYQDKYGNPPTAFNPPTLTLYDINGFKIGKQLPAGNYDVFYLNKIGERLAHVLGEGTIEEKYVLDGFGRRAQKIKMPANSAVTTQQFDQADNLIKVWIPNNDLKRNGGQPLLHQYNYNPENLRTVYIDPGQNRWLTEYDMNHNPLETRLPLGHRTKRRYGYRNILLEEDTCDQEGNPLLQLSWAQLDPVGGYFGYTQTHTDGSQVTTTLGYNKKWELTSRTSINGQNHGQFTQVTKTREQRQSTQGPVLVDVYTLNKIPCPNQFLLYQYIGGRQLSIIDVTLGMHTFFTFDLKDRRQTVKIMRGGIFSIFEDELLHYADATYDFLDRETMINNNGLLAAQFTYDMNGNRRRSLLMLHDEVMKFDQTTDYWFDHDSADRAIVFNGALVNNQVDIDKGQGVKAIYNVANQRSTEITMDDQGNTITTDYGYWISGEISSESKPDLSITYHYDKTGYRSIRSEVNKGATTIENITCDANLFEWKSDVTVTKPATTIFTAYSDGRQILTQKTVDNSNGGKDYYDYTNEYTLYDEYKISGIKGHTWVGSSLDDFNAESQVHYDPNGNNNANYGTSDPTLPDDFPFVVIFICGPEGQIYKKLYLPSQYADGSKVRDGKYDNVIESPSFYTLYGGYLASYNVQPFSERPDKDKIYGTMNYNRMDGAGNTAVLDGNNKGAPQYVNTYDVINLSVGRGVEATQVLQHQVVRATYVDSNGIRHAVGNNPDFKRELDTEDYLQSIDQMNLPAVPSVSIVKATDTFASIGQNLFGTQQDAQSIMAAAADSVPGQEPQAGTVIVTPQFIPSRATSKNYPPSQQVINKIVGGLAPHLIFIQPSPPSSSCRDTVTRIAIDIVAAYIGVEIGAAVSIGVTAATANPVAGVAAGAITAGVVAGVADYQLQDIAAHNGLLSQTSMKEALITGLATGITEGLGGVGELVGIGKDMASVADYAAYAGFEMITAAATNISVQLAEMAYDHNGQLRNQDFNWRDLFNAVVIAGIDAPINAGLSNSVESNLNYQVQNKINAVLNSIINPLVGSAILGEPFDRQQYFASLLGSVIGNAVTLNMIDMDKLKVLALKIYAQNLYAANTLPSRFSLFENGFNGFINDNFNDQLGSSIGLNNSLTFSGDDAQQSVTDNDHKPVTSSNGKPKQFPARARKVPSYLARQASDRWSLSSASPVISQGLFQVSRYSLQLTPPDQKTFPQTANDSDQSASIFSREYTLFKNVKAGIDIKGGLKGVDNRLAPNLSIETSVSAEYLNLGDVLSLSSKLSATDNFSLINGLKFQSEHSAALIDLNVKGTGSLAGATEEITAGNAALNVDATITPGKVHVKTEAYVSAFAGTLNLPFKEICLPLVDVCMQGNIEITGHAGAAGFEVEAGYEGNHVFGHVGAMDGVGVEVGGDISFYRKNKPGR